MPKLLQIRPEFRTSDLELVNDFYIHIIGFEQFFLDPQNRFSILRKDTAELTLVRFPQNVPQGAYLYVEGVEELHTKCQAMQVKIIRPLQVHAHKIKDFVIEDPGGNQVGIGERLES